MDEIEKERDVKLYVLKNGLPIDNFIYYSTNKAVFNWKSYDKKITVDQFKKFCDAAGCPELSSDPCFATNPARVQHRTVLIPLLAKIMLSRSKADWTALLECAGVPCGPIDTIAQALENPQVRARGMRQEIPHPTAGVVKLVANPIKMSSSTNTHLAHPPLLSEHTDQVLREKLNFNQAQIDALRAKGII